MSVTDARLLRNLLGRFPTGVVVVTAETGEGQRLGMTISSFNTVSLDPPLILFSIQRNALSIDLWKSVDRYAVNVLTRAQQGLANKFARARDEKWEGVDCLSSPGHAPVLKGSAVAFQCEAYARYEGGDHEIFLGKIVSLDEEDGARGADPLIFHSGKFRALAEEQAYTPASDAVYLHGW